MVIVEVISSAPVLSPTDLYLPCLIGIINPQHASQVISILSEKLPLELYGLRHLKRARKANINEISSLELVICPQNNEEDISTDIRELFHEIIVINVCRYKPHSRQEFKEWGDSWPIIYRPTELSEERDRGMTIQEQEIIENNLKLLRRLDPQINSSQDKDGIVVNPKTNQVVISSDHVRAHMDTSRRHTSQSIMSNPLYASSPTLLCIEGVAACVRGEIDPQSIDSLPEQQYVCTGLDLYLYSEPDMMSSMALVHSRIRRVVYLHPDPIFGALGSTNSLHEMRALNHRFRVYTSHADTLP